MMIFILQDLDPPLHIGQECLYHRENRQSIEKVHDHVEKSLLIEIDNLKTCQEKLRHLLDRVFIQFGIFSKSIQTLLLKYVFNFIDLCTIIRLQSRTICT